MQVLARFWLKLVLFSATMTVLEQEVFQTHSQAPSNAGRQQLQCCKELNEDSFGSIDAGCESPDTWVDREREIG